MTDQNFAPGVSLEQQLARDEAILRSIGDGLIVADRHSSVILLNKAASQMLGWDQQEAVGLPVAKVAPLEDDRMERNTNLAEGGLSALAAATSANQRSTTYYFVRKDGSKFPVAVTTASVILEKEVIGAVISFRDITFEKEFEKAMREFVAIASHQLRTPLGSMKWNLEMILGEDFGPVNEDTKRVLEQILASNLRMITLINDLLTVSRIGQGKVYEQPQETDIVPIVTESVKEIEPLAQSRSVGVLLEERGEIPKVILDPKRLREAMQNLLSNAVKYTKPGGSVTVNISLAEGKLVVKVADTGIGICEKDKGRVFSKFFRADNALGVDTEGTGLGLYVVKSYVESWGGRIWFESKEGEGTTFYLEIPVAIDQ